jgi:Flp pilus assembly protein CpaB
MATYSSRRRSMSPFGVIVLLLAVLMLLVVGGGVGVLFLAKAGIINLPFLAKGAIGEPSREGWVLAPMSGRNITAYTLVTRDDLANPETHLWNETWVPKGALPENAFTSRNQIIGRVLNHDKGPGYVFTEDDFMPAGTRAGVVAGIPPGKRSLTLEATKIGGIHGLHRGDRFDIVATIPVDKSRQGSPGGRSAALPPPEPEVRVIVESGVIVSPVSMRSTTSTSQSLMNGSKSTTKPVEEVVIALDPAEIPDLTAAITMNASITCVARSGHPEDANVHSVTPDSVPPPEPTAIETVYGSKRETLYLPKVESNGSDKQGANKGGSTKPRYTLPQAAPLVEQVKEPIYAVRSERVVSDDGPADQQP